MMVEEGADLIAALEERRRLAMLHADLDALHDLLDESLVYIHSTGTRDSRASFLDKLNRGLVRYEQLEFTLDAIQRTDRFAWVSGKIDALIRIPDQVLTVHSRYEAVWMNVGATWVLMALQSYPDGQKQEQQ